MRGIANNKDPLSLRTPQFQPRQDIEGPTDQGLHVRLIAQHLHQVRGFRGTKLHGICDDELRRQVSKEVKLAAWLSNPIANVH